MNPRFISNLALATIGGLLLTASLTFGVRNVSWIALGAGAAAFVVSAVAFPGLTRGAAQRRLDALVAILGIWTVVESRVFDDGALRWISFGSGGAFCVLAALGLVLHERDQQRRLDVLAAAGDARGTTGLAASGPRAATVSSTEAAA